MGEIEMPDNTKNRLQTALKALKENLTACNVDAIVASDGYFVFADKQKVAIAPAIQEIKNQANEMINIIENDPLFLDETKADEKPLNSMHREVLFSHYLDVVNTLNAAVGKTNPSKILLHQNKLENLASVS